MNLRNPRALLANRLLDLLTLGVRRGLPLPLSLHGQLQLQIAPGDLRLSAVWLFQPTLEHYHNIFQDMNILFYMKNSAIIAVSSTLLTI